VFVLFTKQRSLISVMITVSSCEIRGEDTPFSLTHAVDPMESPSQTGNTTTIDRNNLPVFWEHFPCFEHSCYAFHWQSSFAVSKAFSVFCTRPDTRNKHNFFQRHTPHRPDMKCGTDDLP